jgi:hypothetical protein
MTRVRAEGGDLMHPYEIGMSGQLPLRRTRKALLLPFESYGARTSSRLASLPHDQVAAKPQDDPGPVVVVLEG